MRNKPGRFYQYWVMWLMALFFISCAPRSSEMLLQSVDKDQAIGWQMARQVEQTMGHYDEGGLNACVTGVMQRLVAQHDDKRFPTSLSPFVGPLVKIIRCSQLEKSRSLHRYHQNPGYSHQ